MKHPEEEEFVNLLNIWLEGGEFDTLVRNHVHVHMNQLKLNYVQNFGE